jgi:hypothetical protein
LDPPTVAATDGGESEHLDFWDTHETLLQDAWKEWEQQQDTSLPELAEISIMDPGVSEGIRYLWNNPSIENEKRFQKDFWKEPIPGVYTCNRFLTEEGIRRIRTHLKAASKSGIPTRRPNGMNRYGLVLDAETQGGVSYSQLDGFRHWLVEEYVRPLGRMFFPESIGSFEDDESSYAFTIDYQNQGESNNNNNTTTTTDIKLKEHSDASVVTMNINLNLPEEAVYSGSQLMFLDDISQERHEVELQPGMVVVHRGLHRHQALPIQKGERHQLIIWLMGRYGYVRFVPYEEKEQLSVEERWSKQNENGRDAKTGPFEL